MRAAQITELSGPDAVAVGEVDAPALAPGQLLIDVHAAGVNFPDLLLTRVSIRSNLTFRSSQGPKCQASSRTPQPGPVSKSAIGSRLSRCSTELPNRLWSRPTSLSESLTPCHSPKGAALPMNYLTMEFALIRRGGLARGETVLIHGAAGGIGTAGIQISKALRSDCDRCCLHCCEARRRAGSRR